MFVNDGHISVMKVKVINCLGEEWIVSVYPEITVDQLKQMALVHFFHPLSCIKTADQYRLVSVTKGQRLLDECTIREENLEEKEELLLLKGRLQPEKSEETAEERNQKLHGPMNAEIQFATANISQKNMFRVVEDNPVVVGFHSELRKILVSLVQASEKLLRYHPEVIDIFKETSVESESSIPDTTINADALKQLTDMGFPKSKALTALRINKMSPTEATEWLLAHEDESPSVASAESTSQVCEAKSEDTTQSLESTASCSEGNPNSYAPRKVATILKCFRQYKRKEFRPNLKAFNNLKEMGFSEEEILDALRIHSNNQEAACEWLLNDRKSDNEDLDIGLDPEGSIYKAIMANAIVQLGLNSLKTLFALLQMLENFNSAGRWLNDSDIAPLLSQIFRIYHAEKHSLQMMRPFSH
ncbi:ubiquitin-associated domain-containing protein 1-like isoform X1 [Centruroides sculpturatus]|uniref:ubiquitin-associated domain-containing protein 1-like isoform X1 n=2 Tax=Centruroides sculpturatus TaxID=218467 RepID=UPI000C6EC0FC|nr:ubiquitin-associated domain-containing protein 1-like isoform X1 [Centruroides sculpturatus]